jgi:hypothetical protein
MGSNTEEPPLQEDDEITVLVTGFAVSNYPLNKINHHPQVHCNTQVEA